MASVANGDDQNHEMSAINTVAGNTTSPSIEAAGLAAPIANDPVAPNEPSAKAQLPTLAIPEITTPRNNSIAIGPATDLATPLIHPDPSPASHEPFIRFTLLLASTGTRHVYHITERYLSKRGITALDADGVFDPSTLNVYTLKELILKDWREDWDEKPVSPTAIRLISFGQLLDDNATLKECKMNANGGPHVLHISVKPADLVDNDELTKSRGKVSMAKELDSSRPRRLCCCIVM